MRTPQEEFWAGEFGTDYISRNDDERGLAANVRMFAEALAGAGPIESCIELGANIGHNLQALKILHPAVRLKGVEINTAAATELRKHAEVDECSILEWEPSEQFDLSVAKTVLIHIPPDRLSEVYERLYNASKRLIFICEYYNPTPLSVSYRGHDDRLFKRDFAGEMLERFADLKLLKYGFLYRNDPAFLHDDQTWFLLEKRAAA